MDNVNEPADNLAGRLGNISEPSDMPDGWLGNDNEPADNLNGRADNSKLNPEKVLVKNIFADEIIVVVSASFQNSGYNCWMKKSSVLNNSFSIY